MIWTILDKLIDIIAEAVGTVFGMIASFGIICFIAYVFFPDAWVRVELSFQKICNWGQFAYCGL